MEEHKGATGRNRWNNRNKVKDLSAGNLMT